MRVVPMVLVAACTSSSAEPIQVEVAPKLPTPLDVLVVVDQSSAQTALIPDPANLAGVLQGIYNGAPDLRIAVTTTTTGTLRTSPLAPSGVIQHTLRMADGSVDKNYTGDLASAVGSLLRFDAPDTAPNTALASTVLALDSGHLQRPGAALGILLVSSTDDASPAAPSTYADAIAAHATRTMVSAVDRQPAPRITSLLAGMTNRYERGIDEYNMESISTLSWLFDPTTPDSCFPLDVAAPGDCELFSASSMVANPLAVCSGDSWTSPTPCFTFVADASCASGWTVLFGGPYSYYHPTVFGRCTM